MPLVVPKGAKLIPVKPKASTRLSWSPTNLPLFAGQPQVNDTKQGGIADCFILASLIAILSKKTGPGVIDDMMKEENGTVIVRLYGEGNGKLGWLYFEVQKGVVQSGNAPPHRSCCWVDVLEAALSVFPMKALNHSDQVGPADLDNLDNGQPEYALFHLLGKEAKTDQIIGPKFDASASVEVQNRHAGIAFVNLILDPAECLKEKQAIENMFGSPQLAGEYMNWITINTQQMKVKWKTFVTQKKYEHVVTVNTVKQTKIIPISIRQHNFLQFVDQNFDSKFAPAVKKFAEEAYGTPGQTLFHGRRKDALVYSVNEDQLFDNLKNCLNQKWPVVATSNEWVGTPTGQGMSGGEDMAKGILGGHAYAVTGLKLAKVKVSGKVTKLVGLVNPWGWYVRVYQNSVPVGTEQNTDQSQGVMWLDVRTVAKRFESYAFCKQPI
jgi:Calpain family cysteine protease